MAYVGMYVTLV